MSDNQNTSSSSGTIPSQAQIVIIGGGVIGCSIAYHLTKLGRKDVHRTVCVTCGWAGVDKTPRAGFCSGVENARKCRRIPPVKCTLCWADILLSLSFSANYLKNSRLILHPPILQGL